MKSIMQEASSVIKALEKAWQNAGQPKEFSIKVYEEPEKNFFGMTTKSAKIGIFFKQEAVGKREQRPRVRAEVPPSKVYEPKRQPSRKSIAKEPHVATKPVAPRQQRVMWTEEMVASASKWVSDALRSMEKSGVSFTTNVNNYYIRFTFDAPVGQSPEKERQIFRNFSFLLLQSLKRQLKRPLRGFKVVLTRES